MQLFLSILFLCRTMEMTPRSWSTPIQISNALLSCVHCAPVSRIFFIVNIESFLNFAVINHFIVKRPSRVTTIAFRFLLP